MGLPPPRKTPKPQNGGPGDAAALGTSAHEAPGSGPGIGPGPATPGRLPSAWRSRESDYGPPRSDPAVKVAHDQKVREEARRKATRRATLLLVFSGGFWFLSGYLIAYKTFWFPGVFLASQIGVPAILSTLLFGAARILREGIGDRELAQATGGLPRAGAWSVGIFWFFHTFTNVWQLSVSMALAILAFQLYATHDRARRAGYRSFGPGLKATLWPMAAYIGWLVMFGIAGTVPLFDLLSLIASFTFAFFFLQSTRRAAAMAEEEHRRDPKVAAAAPTKRGATAKHLLVGVAIGYLFFRFFVSANIPYGPIVEWFIVSLAALFFAVMAASRIGTVPTTRSLPPSHVRTHRQRVWSLPDEHISRIEHHLGAYIHENKDRAWVRDHYARLMDASGVPPESAQAALQALDRRRLDRDGRREAILRLTRLLQDTNGTDRVKTGPGVERPGPAWKDGDLPPTPAP